MDSVLKYFIDSLTIRAGKAFFQVGETDKIEYKQSFQLSGEIINKGYLKTICGFVNNKGGVIVLE